MKALYLLAASLFFLSVSCERHDWEDTRKLHEGHGHAGQGEADHGGDGSTGGTGEVDH